MRCAGSAIPRCCPGTDLRSGCIHLLDEWNLLQLIPSCFRVSEARFRVGTIMGCRSLLLFFHFKITYVFFKAYFYNHTQNNLAAPDGMWNCKSAPGCSPLISFVPLLLVAYDIISEKSSIPTNGREKSIQRWTMWQLFRTEPQCLVREHCALKWIKPLMRCFSMHNNFVIQ